MYIEIDGISIEILKKPVKNINLRIYPPDGQVKVSIPLKYSEHVIRQQLKEKSEWIRAQQERIRIQSCFKEESLQTGSTILFKGKTCLLIIEEHHGPSQIIIDNELIHCHIQPNSTFQQKQRIVDLWYRKEMNAEISRLMAYWEPIINVNVFQLGIKKMKTRWGSCNTRAHRIWLNLNLIKKPVECLEYVLVHEMVHILEASHNKRFYALMTQFMPDWRDRQEVLEGKKAKEHISTFY
ncbi:zinc metalloprotease [Legionella norrlandica]|uniref:Zinc metalloprotease n=1 Tax=Legionella norrlandica TaxID=1498499 RepID=A0A0A2SQH8_9GAMM|nr:SprT family zinc-dependent metalloprotease [Legionella norrlandica]KGP63007.1 zinc metalloprotease [Legionella norrlandica]